MLLSKLHLAFLDIESTGWLCTHENGLLEIFLMVCETSEAGFSGQDARRQQMSCTAAALLWPSGARFFATSRLRLNPTVSLNLNPDRLIQAVITRARRALP